MPTIARFVMINADGAAGGISNNNVGSAVSIQVTRERYTVTGSFE
jgi:hypothetical protein